MPQSVNIAQTWKAVAAALSPLCVGASIKPFCWQLGDISHLRKPGGRLVAFGPLRLAWRFRA